MKRYGTLAGIAFAVLVFASVWLGALNQDEGWYLYAARLVAEGKVMYRDFFYTQGPLLPLVYSAFCGAWEDAGLVGGRIVTASIGLLALVFAAALARFLAPAGRKGAAGTIAFMLLGCNLYHVYYTSIPKTYALASFFLLIGFYLLAFSLRMLPPAYPEKLKNAFVFFAGLTMALSAGARVSLILAVAVVATGLFAVRKTEKMSFAWFAGGAFAGLMSVYGFVLFDSKTFHGLLAAMSYHGARGGFDPIFTIGSASRLVRWYAPLFVLLGMVFFRKRQRLAPESDMLARSRFPLNMMACSFLAVFALQMFAPYPYEDYQVPVMPLLAVYVAVKIVSIASLSLSRVVLLTLGMTWALSFGSPLLEKWTVNGQDRFWALKKEKTELAQLQDIARLIEAIDPGGKKLFTQDIYLAIETNRKVPKGLEMGPFSMLSHDEWVDLLENTDCNVAALSGYTFAVNPPVCTERPIEEQMEYWSILKRRYRLFMKENAFGQHATPLLVLTKKGFEQ